MERKNLVSRTNLILFPLLRESVISKSAREQNRTFTAQHIIKYIRFCVFAALFLCFPVIESFGQKVSIASGTLNALTTWTDLIAGTGNITIVVGTTGGTNSLAGSIAINDALFDNSNSFIGIVTATPTANSFTLQNSA
ncbi:MAG: hypothetical protein EPN88_16570, partial [Bacteroidetes bacterium]